MTMRPTFFALLAKNLRLSFLSLMACAAASLQAQTFQLNADGGGWPGVPTTCCW